MKKFLTVLLALSVVFTYTVGSAFALPSDTDTEAGLEAAKAEAIQELKDYPDMSAYDAVGQAKVKAIIAKYTEAISNAKKVGNANDGNGANSVYGYLNSGKWYIDQVDKADAVKAAKKAAIAQFNDYVYVIEKLDVDGMNDAVKDAKVGYETYDAFKTASQAAINAATDVEGVEKALTTALKKADKVFALLKEVVVPQEKIDKLVKDIRAEAGRDNHKVTDKTHSAAVIKAYEDAIEEGVAAAKAVKTFEDYHKVVDKYLGCGETHVAYYPEENDVVIHIYQQSIFAKLAAKTLEVEADIKAVNKLLDRVGDYDWKDYVDAVNFEDAAKWSNIEEFYYQARYFAENGSFYGDLSSASAPQALKTLIDGVNASSKTNEVNAALDEAETVIDALNVVEGYKAAKANAIQSYCGNTIWDKKIAIINPTDDLESHYGDNTSLVKALQLQGAVKIGNATTIDEVDAVYAEFVAKINDVKTKEEVAFDKSVKAYNASVDQYVAENKATDMTTDEEVLLNRVVNDLKAKYIEALETRSFDVSTYDSAVVFAAKGPEYGSAGNAGADYGYTFTAGNDYYAENAGHVQAVIDGFNQKVAGTGATKITTWVGFFNAYDAAAAEIDKYQTKTQENYVAKIAAAETTINALGTPELTNAFKIALGKADAAYAEYETAAEAFFALPADEQAEVTVALTVEGKYIDAKHEYNRLVYLQNQAEGTTSIPEVATFYTIAKAFVGSDIQSHYNRDGRLEIANIIEATFDAIEKATTDDAKATAALAGIAKLDAVALDNSADQDTADLLATVKAEAAKYFDKYYGSSFTSDASTKIDLIKDIIAFNDQFLKAEENTKRIEAVKSFKIKCTTKRYTGKKMVVNWTIDEGDESAIDGYRVYFSTKKTNSGYTYLTKTKKHSINHVSIKTNKNVKKGQRVFYRVRAYAEIDGVRYFSDYSTVGNRIWK